MSDINTSPVSLAGSFDLGELQKGLDRAAKGKPDAYEGAVAAALKGARADDIATPDARDIPGYKFVDVENEELGVTENQQVFDPKLAEELATTGAIPEAESRNNQARATAEAAGKATSPKE